MSMSYEERVRHAKKTGEKAKGYWLTQSRYLQQIGDGGPVYVQAAPALPVKVLLPDGVVVLTRPNGEKVERQLSKEDAFLKLIVDEAEPPKKPVDSHLPGKKPEPVKKAHEKHGEKHGE